MEFIDFKIAIQEQMKIMFEEPALLEVDTDKDKIWEVYLSSFPEGTNPIFRKRTEHDCSACKHFIRDAGGIVTVKNGKYVSIWDVNIDYPYNVVTEAMSKYIKSLPIRNIFLHYQKTIGIDSNKELLESGQVVSWDHFFTTLPDRVVKDKHSIGGLLSNAMASKDVLKRSLEDISTNTAKTVFELIEQGSLYRGEEHKQLVERFIELKNSKEYKELNSIEEFNIFCWTESVKSDAVARIRNSVIGSLMIDIEEGKELDAAVASFENKVAPTNYKRPTAIITKGMIELAQAEIEKLGLTKALERRPAIESDISVNDIIFTNRNTLRTSDNIFDSMKADIKVNPKELKKVEEVTIDKFISDILPSSTSIEILFENRHKNNLMSLIAPTYADAPILFKWNNGFSWSYNGEVADSIKEKVKRAGGCVDAIMRWSLSWFNMDDLDIHMIEPNKNKIYFGNKKSSTSGELDVDMNVNNAVRNAVENIVHTNEHRMCEGEYTVIVNNFRKREDTDVGFIIEAEYKGNTYTFNYRKPIRNGEDVQVAKFVLSKEKGITFLESLPEDSISKNIWNLDTQKYHNAKLIMLSPNFWNNGGIGNKHWFFILDNCHNASPARGLYNEFLNEEMMKHRKVLEMLASKTKVAPSEDQLCGLGFSSTKKDSFYCKVSGTFSRILKVNI